MIVKKCLSLGLVAVLVCSVCAGLVVGSEGDGISEYIEVPEGSPIPSSSPNATVTPNATVSPSTVYVGLDRVQSINPFGNPIIIPAYNSTIVTLRFAEALTCAVNVTSGGAWNDQRDSSGIITFYPRDVGIYELRFQVLYGQVVNQSITLTVFSGDDTQFVMNLESINSGFTLDVVLNIQRLQEIPTAEEIAAAQNEMQRRLVEDMDSRFSGQVVVSQVVAVAAIVIGCVLAVLVFMVIRHQRHRDMAITELRSGCGTRGKA